MCIRDSILYRWTRLVEGLKPASGHCQAAITKLLHLREEPGVCLYTDDILLFHRTWQEHLATLSRVLRRAIKAGLKFKLRKCIFLQSEVVWLGRRISHGVVHPSYDYLGTVLDRPRPETVGAVRSWAAAVGWVVEHLPGAPTLLAPIHALTHLTTLQAAGARLRGGKVARSTPVVWTLSLIHI